MKATYTPDIDDQLRRWNADGMPVADQARRLGVPRGRVHGWRYRLGLSSATDAVLPPELDTKIKDWVSDGWPLREIAETAGLSLKLVRAKFPQAAWTPAQQGSMGAAVMRAVRADPYIMRGL